MHMEFHVIITADLQSQIDSANDTDITFEEKMVQQVAMLIILQSPLDSEFAGAQGCVRKWGINSVCHKKRTMSHRIFGFWLGILDDVPGQC